MDKQSKKNHPNFKTIEDYPIRKGFFYIIWFKNVMKPKLAPYHFSTQRAAERGLENHFTMGFRKYCTILSYSEATNFFMTYKMGMGIRHYKHDYSVYDITKQEKKNIRIKNRRRLRRMGLLTSVRASYKVNKDIADAKAIAGAQQMVLYRKNPQAKGISIEGKPGMYYLVQEREEIHNHSKYLFKVHGYKFDASTCKLTKVRLKIAKNQILHAYLLMELNELIHEICQEAKKEIPKGWRNQFWYSFLHPIKGRLSKEQEAAYSTVQEDLVKVARGQRQKLRAAKRAKEQATNIR